MPRGATRALGSFANLTTCHLLANRQIIAKHTSMTALEVAAAIDRNLYLTPSEALERGLIDSIVVTKPPPQPPTPTPAPPAAERPEEAGPYSK